MVKVPLITGLEGFDNPESYGVYRATGGQALGSVGKDFTPTQPKLLFEEFENCLYHTDCDFNDVTYLELKGGKKIVFEAPIKKMGYTNHVAKTEDRNDYLLVGGGLKLNDIAQKVALEMA